jgi:hypothetical protein
MTLMPGVAIAVTVPDVRSVAVGVTGVGAGKIDRPEDERERTENEPKKERAESRHPTSDRDHACGPGRQRRRPSAGVACR